MLGAGASKAAGAPLMSEFLTAMRDIQESGIAAHRQADFDLLFKGYDALQSVYARLNVDYDSDFEELLGTFELARILGRLGNLSGKDVGELPGAMRRAIGATIEYGMEYPVAQGGVIMAHNVFRNFVSFLAKLRKTEEEQASILTFNYDVGIEFALIEREFEIEYGLGGFKSNNRRVLKLHGSLNWGQCQECKDIIPYPLEQFKEEYGLSQHVNENEFLQTSEVLPDIEHCGKPLKSEPYIVPPTWNKTEYHEPIADIWKAASEEIASARNFVLIGYSIPDTDIFFKHLLGLSLSAGVFIDKFIVINPDPEAAVRLQAILSTALAAKTQAIVGSYGSHFATLKQILSN